MADVGAKRQGERVKLLASALSNLGVASIVAGLVGPALGGRLKGAIGGEAAVAGLLLHGVAQLLLHYVVVTPGAETADDQEAEP